MFCQKCGRQIQENALFCAHCGASVRQSDEKGKWVVAWESFSKSRKLSILIGAIWFVIWFIFSVVCFIEDEELGWGLLLVAVFGPVLYALIKNLIPLLKRTTPKTGKLSLAEFSKQFDEVKLETVYNKLKEEITSYCVFYKKTRASFGESLRNCSSEEFRGKKDEIIVISKNGKYYLEHEKSEN